MAYHSTHLEHRGPLEHSSLYDRPSPNWGATYVPPSQRPFGHSPLQQLQAQHGLHRGLSQDEMDPERSDSDVSTTKSDFYRTASSPAMPVRAPMPPAILESHDAIDRRLAELSRIEDSNSNKTRELQSKRQRMDERIRQKRMAQDQKIKSIMDARQRRDARILARRTREDAEFQRVFDDLEQEEGSLRRRLKRLKRGLPLDDSPQIPGRSLSTASTSPPGPTYSTIPPPAKRHQSNPPGQNDSPGQTHLPPPVPAAHPPSYSFYQGGPKPYSTAYNGASSYSTAPPPTQNGPPSTASPLPHERLSLGLNGRPSSPLTRPPQTSSAPISSVLSTVPPARGTPSAYDTRPPPAGGAGFAAVNQPPSNPGFAPINPRSTATPPDHRLPSDEHIKLSTSTLYPDAGKHGSNNSTPATGKRTPSTTHPYQMSEAFANRHHHCERVDDLNRGIWTSYGPGGTQEAPTGPTVEMYLRCNHEDCRRIDWRTVHGLQCHIVKSHEQPKGTIGSLEKALDRYGVPVKEVEEYEREHGEGTGGTMADPKNMKIKNKTREAGSAKKTTPGSYGVDSTVRPAGYKPSPTASPTAVHAIPRHNGFAPHYPPTGPPKSTTTWSSVNNISAYGPPRAPIDTNKSLQGDAVMKDAEPAPMQQPAPASATDRKPYDFAPRPFEYPSRAHPIPPSVSDKPTTGPATVSPNQNKPSWNILNDTKASPQAQPTTIPHQPTWVARPQWSSSPQQDAEAKTIAAAQPGANKKDQVADQATESKTENKDTAMSGVAAPLTPVSPSETTQQDQKTVSAISDKEPVSSAAIDAMAVDSEPAKPVTATPATEVTTASSPLVNGMSEKTVQKEGDMDPPSMSTASATAASGGPASSTRSTQSPSMTNKPLSAPTSVRRGSRRSSIVRRGSVDMGDAREPATNLPQVDVVSAATAGEAAKVSAVDRAEIGNSAVPGTATESKSEDKMNGDDRKIDADDDNDGESITVTAPRMDNDGPTSDGPRNVQTAGDLGRGAAADSMLKDKDKMEPRTPPPRRAASGRLTRKRIF